MGDLGYTYNGLSGKTKQDFDTGEAFYIPFLNVLENTEIDINNLGRVKVSSLEKQVCVQKSDLFFNTSSETPEEVGMCAYLSQELNNTFLNSFCFGFRLYDKCAVDPRFLTYLFNSVYGRRVISSLAQGVTRYNLSKERLLRSEIHLPPITEQHRIANCINIVEENIVETNTLISKYEAIKKATVKLLLKPKSDWPRVKLGEAFTFGNGYTPAKATKEYWENGAIPWFRMEDIRANGRILKDSIQHITAEAIKGGGLFPAGSFILSTTATLGEYALLITDSMANQQFTFLVKDVNRNHEIDTMWFLQFLAEIGEWCRKTANAGGLLAVNMNDLCNYEIPLPPIDEQKRIVTILESIDSAIKCFKAQLGKSQAIKQGMMTYFFG